MRTAFLVSMKIMNTHKALTLVITMLAFCPSLHALEIRIGDTAAARIAKNSHIPGKDVPGQCLPFANALHAKFEAAGIPSEVLVYGYQATAGPGMAVSAAVAGGQSC